MKMKVAKNGKYYRCDFCSKLLHIEEVCSWVDENVGKTFHFCTKTHKRNFIVNRYNLPMFPQNSEQVTGNVIPVKNGTIGK